MAIAASATAAAGGARGASAARTTAQARAPGQQAVARCVRSARRGGRGAIPARRRRTPPAAILAIDASERLRASARSVCTGATAMAARGAALGARARRRRPPARAPGLTGPEPSAPHAALAIGVARPDHHARTSSASSLVRIVARRLRPSRDWAGIDATAPGRRRASGGVSCLHREGEGLVAGEA